MSTLSLLSQTVYGHVFPEVEAVVKELWKNHTEELLTRYREPWSKKQDEMHASTLDSWNQWSSTAVEGLCEFKHAYPTAGASEGIRELLAVQALQRRPLVVFEGEYEGYEKIAAHYRVKIQKANREQWCEELQHWPKDTTVWLSQPSAIDGNVWPNYDVFLRILSEVRPDVQVWVDLSYVGAVADWRQKIKIDYPCIQGVVVSWSKPFGVYYHRIGAVWSKQEQPGLWGNKWFKNLFALKLGEELCSRFPIGSLAKISQQHQARVIAGIQASEGVALRPSDVALLATVATSNAPEDWKKTFNRAPTLPFLRVCLTPAFNKPNP